MRTRRQWYAHTYLFVSFPLFITCLVEPPSRGATHLNRNDDDGAGAAMTGRRRRRHGEDGDDEDENRRRLYAHQQHFFLSFFH